MFLRAPQRWARRHSRLTKRVLLAKVDTGGGHQGSRNVSVDARLGKATCLGDFTTGDADTPEAPPLLHPKVSVWVLPGCPGITPEPRAVCQSQGTKEEKKTRSNSPCGGDHVPAVSFSPNTAPALTFLPVAFSATEFHTQTKIDPSQSGCLGGSGLHAGEHRVPSRGGDDFAASGLAASRRPLSVRRRGRGYRLRLQQTRRPDAVPDGSPVGTAVSLSAEPAWGCRRPRSQGRGGRPASRAASPLWCSLRITQLRDPSCEGCGFREPLGLFRARWYRRKLQTEGSRWGRRPVSS